MRILFLTPSPPRPDGGGAAIRNWHLIQAARAAGHIVDIGTFRDTQTTRMHPRSDADIAIAAPPPDERGARKRMIDFFMRKDPDLARRLRSGLLSVWIGMRFLHTGSPEKAGYDAIQVEGLEMWANLPEQRPDWITRAVRHDRGRFAFVTEAPTHPARPNLPPLIYDAHNAETTLQRRTATQAVKTFALSGAAYSILQWLKLRAYERSVIRHAVATLAVSPSDAAALEHLSNRPVDVVPIGVDTRRYDWDAPDMSRPIPFDVVFSGTLDYRPNTDAAIWLLRAIWPRIRAAKPDATLAIVGRNPTPAMQQCNGKDGITITGEVPDDRPYMAGAGVYVLPIRFGAGVRVKLLNAMSMGCAVVATEMACEGVAAQSGEHLVATQAHPGAFAAATVALLDDPARRTRLGAAARSLMVERYDWSIVTPALLAVYDRLGAAHG